MDEVWLARFRAGDAEVWTGVVRQHGPELRAVARRIVGDEPSAYDVVNEMFYRTYRARAQFDGRFGLWPWLCRVTCREACNVLRQRKRRLDVQREDAEAPDPAVSVERRLLARSEIDFVVRQLPRLTAVQHEVFELRVLRDASLAEAAALLGITEDLVCVRLHRARVALGQLLRRAA